MGNKVSFVVKEYTYGRYEGDFSEYHYERRGIGTMYYKDGSIYEGEWNNDVRHGKGVLTNKDRYKLFEGKWCNGHIIEGVYYYINGDRYEGTYYGGNLVNGILYKSNGDKYEGIFNTGKFSHGIATRINGEKEWWEDGVKVI